MLTVRLYWQVNFKVYSGQNKQLSQSYQYQYEGLEGYSRDPGLDQNTVRESEHDKYLDGI